LSQGHPGSEHYFASKSFDAVDEAFSNEYRDKEVPKREQHYTEL
jgi:hypothetical protein